MSHTSIELIVNSTKRKKGNIMTIEKDYGY